MKVLPGLLVALIAIAGCTPIVEPSPKSTSSTTALSSTAAASSSPTTIATTTTTRRTTTTTEPPGPPLAWISPSGVPLAVTGVRGDSVEVLTPCGDPALLSEGSPIYEVDVVIDPGHGGPIDTGAVAATGLEEKDINLQVARAVHQLLEERGIASMLTRSGDYPVPIPTRSAYSDIVGAEAMVSIHHNAPAAPESEIPGVEIFVQSGTPESARLGGLIYDETMSALSQFDVAWQRAPDAGAMTVLNTDGGDAYGMVRLPETTSALVELGYIANPAEAELYASPEYVPAVATAVANAVETFLKTQEKGSPLVEGRIFNPQAGVGRDQCIEPDLELNR